MRLVRGLRETSLRRPRATVLVWVVLMVGLSVVGLDVQRVLSSSMVEEVPGSQSALAYQMDREHFGENVTVPILLTGPEAALDRQGPALVRELRASGHMRTLSPWDTASGAGRLAPEPGRAMISVAVGVQPGTDPEEVLPELNRITDSAVSPPVRAHVSGVPAIVRALQEASMEAAHAAERVAVPVLVVVLLLVFRSVIAALIPLVVGVATVGAGYGVLVLLSSVLEVNVFASSLVAMMGLALGVDYSLLLVSRFREELHAGELPGSTAAAAAAATAGRTVAVAAVALVSAMGVALLIVPSQLLLSVVLGVIVAACLAAWSALLVLPSMLALLGGNIDRWSLRQSRGRSPATAMARRALRRPLVAGLMALVALLALLTPALGLTTGPMDARELPPGDPARQSYQLLEDTMGEGWAGPFEVLVVADEGSITRQERLETLQRWQQRIGGWPGVDTVVGPGPMADTGAKLRRVDQRLSKARDQMKTSGRELERLERGLGRAGSGTQRLSHGLADAAAALARMEQGVQAGAPALGEALGKGAGGATRLAEGIARAVSGARRLARGAEEAQQGAQRLDDGMARLAHGAGRLRDGGERAADGARLLADRLRSGADRLEELKDPAVRAVQETTSAQGALEDMTVGKSDPQYARALKSVMSARAALTGRDPVTGRQLDSRYPGLPRSLDQAAAGMRRAADAAANLATGLSRLQAGLARLAEGATRLEHGTRQLATGLDRVAGGNRQLAAKLDTAQDGAQRLAAGLTRMQSGVASATAKMQRLRTGLGRVQGGVATAARRSGDLAEGLQQGERATSSFSGRELSRGAKAIDRFQHQSPGFFDSGYYVLATMQGAPPAQRDRANFAVDVETGGDAARILVIPQTSPEDPRTDHLAERLQAHMDELSRDIDGRAAVGGQAGMVHDFEESASNSFVWLLLGLSLASYAVLVPVFRSLLLPAISVFLNLLTVGAAFGPLQVLFTGDNPLLGGPGHINVVAMNAMLAVIFALSIDYQVFLVTRMREGFLLTGDGQEAIRHGINTTARIITGAAVIMAAVFIAFAFTSVSTTAMFGVGLATATLLDATLVRLVLLPGLMRLCGRWTWWMPTWLDKILPDIDLEGSTTHTAPTPT